MSTHADLIDKVEIRGSTEIPEADLLDFFREMFPDRAELLCHHWRWLYRIEQFPEIKPPLVAILDGRVIGHVAQIPVVISVGGREQLGAWGVDGGVLPAFRKSGLGSHLMDMWIKHFPICLGFCTEALFRILVKQGWSPRRTTFALQLPFRPDRHPKLQNGKWKTARRFAGAGWSLIARSISRARTVGHDRLRETTLSPQRLKQWEPLQHPEAFAEPVHIPRTPEFLAWRLLDNPYREQYRLLESGESNVVAIVRMVRSGDLRRAQIVSLSGKIEDDRALPRFLGGFVAWAMDQRLDLIKLVSSDPYVVGKARRWLPIRGTLRFVSFCHQAEVRDAFERSGHLWELIDYDLDFLT